MPSLKLIKSAIDSAQPGTTDEELRATIVPGVANANTRCLKIEQDVLYACEQADVRGASMDGDSYSEKALAADLRTWWDSEVGGEDDPFADPKPAASGTIFDVLPAIDSLGCVNGLLTIEKHVGFEVPSRILRRGGYSSLEDMVSDLLPKVRSMVERRQTPRRKEAA